MITLFESMVFYTNFEYYNLVLVSPLIGPEFGRGPRSITKIGLHTHPPPPPHLFYMKERFYGYQIQYVTFTNINETIHKICNPTILWGGEGSNTPTPHPSGLKPTTTPERLEISENPQSF